MGESQGGSGGYGKEKAVFMIRFISSNKHKYEEIKSMMENAGIEIQWINMKYEEIQEESIDKISLDSANKLIKSIGENFFIEDSGIIIKDLQGFPGPYSSYVQKTIGNEGILKLMEGRNREASFVTVVTYWNGARLHQFRGETNGTIATSIFEGRNFGYDPIFIPEGFNETVSLIPISRKNEISQRGKAIRSFIKYLKDSGSEAKRDEI